MRAKAVTNNPASGRILQLHASGRRADSTSRLLSDELVRAIAQGEDTPSIVVRDLADGVPHVNEAWIEANLTPAEERNAAQREALAVSDSLVAELRDADVIVIGVPIYNFGVPAALKAWIDMIARARLTFRYTHNGPEGLLNDKKAYLVVTSGGVAVDSLTDFATPYLRQVLGFVGIDDVEVVNVERINQRGDEAIHAARRQIEALSAADDSAGRELTEEQTQ